MGGLGQSIFRPTGPAPNVPLLLAAGKITLGEYLERWLTDSVRGTVWLSTFERHEQIVRAHVNPALGRIKLNNLTPPHVRGLIAEKLESGLDPATVRKIHSTLHKALSGAVSDGLIPRNAADVKAPRPTPERCAHSQKKKLVHSWKRHAATPSRPSTYSP